MCCITPQLQLLMPPITGNCKSITLLFCVSICKPHDAVNLLFFFTSFELKLSQIFSDLNATFKTIQGHLQSENFKVNTALIVKNVMQLSLQEMESVIYLLFSCVLLFVSVCMCV